MRPIIGLTHSLDLGETSISMPRSYADAILAAGGTPLLLPVTTDATVLAHYASIVDGFLFTGGDDVDPRCYGEDQIYACGEVHPLRDRYELALCRLALASGKPVLGICRGIQLINVACGGTLYQDLPSQKPGCICHGQKQPSCYASHAVQIAPGSRLHALFGDSALVNSHHHQAVKALGANLRVTADAHDGVIEAFEGTDGRYLIGVQWHPERLVTREENAAHKALFADFAAACGK